LSATDFTCCEISCEIESEWRGAGVIVCLERGADLHIASWCHCHSLSLASVKSRLVLRFWYRLTWVVPDKGPLNVFMCVCWRYLVLCCWCCWCVCRPYYGYHRHEEMFLKIYLYSPLILKKSVCYSIYDREHGVLWWAFLSVEWSKVKHRERVEAGQGICWTSDKLLPTRLVTCKVNESKVYWYSSLQSNLPNCYISILYFNLQSNLPVGGVAQW